MWHEFWTVPPSPKSANIKREKWLFPSVSCDYFLLYLFLKIKIFFPHKLSRRKVFINKFSVINFPGKLECISFHLMFHFYKHFVEITTEIGKILLFIMRLVHLDLENWSKEWIRRSSTNDIQEKLHGKFRLLNLLSFPLKSVLLIGSH